MARTPRRGAAPGTLLGLKAAIRARKCRLCRCDLPPKRKNAWCGKACVDRWFILSGDVKAIRAALLARDKEVCQVCGCDLFLVRRLLRRMDHESGVAFLVQLGWSAGKAIRMGLWEADHILPLVEGGTHDLSNLRCLCVPCHVHLTRELSRRRSL